MHCCSYHLDRQISIICRKFSISRTGGPKKKFQYATNNYAWMKKKSKSNLCLCSFLSGACCLWGRDRVRKEASYRNGSSIESERTLKRKMCCACHNPRHSVWIERKWQSRRFVVSDGAKTSFFSLRWWALQVSQLVISKLSAHDGFHVLHLCDVFFIDPFWGEKGRKKISFSHLTWVHLHSAPQNARFFFPHLF